MGASRTLAVVVAARRWAPHTSGSGSMVLEPAEGAEVGHTPGKQARLGSLVEGPEVAGRPVVVEVAVVAHTQQVRTLALEGRQVGVGMGTLQGGLAVGREASRPA